MSFESGIATDESRRFLPFLDPVDMTGYFPADATLAEVNARAAAHGLRYPLVITPDASLRDHLAVADHAPASARFGNYADNIPGMNWELPSGRPIRVGERVVKSTTGYDLLRFLLHGGERFGHATGYVLRLRPTGGETGSCRATGAEPSLASFAASLRRSCWSHWLDVVDAVAAPGSATHLAIRFDCMMGESALFMDHLDGLSRDCDVRIEAVDPPIPGSLPSFTLKTTPARAMEFATRCVSDLEATVHANLLCGSLLVFTEKPPPAEWIASTRDALASEGGHVLAPGLPPPASQTERQWIQLLENEWRTI